MLAQGEVVGEGAVGLVEERDAGVADDRGGGPLLGLAQGARARAGRRRGPRRPGRRSCSTRASRPSPRRSSARPSPAGPNSASSGWAAMTMNRAGRQAWCGAGSRPVSVVIAARHEAGVRRRCGVDACAAPDRGVRFRPRLRSSPPTSEASSVSGDPRSVTPPRRLLARRARRRTSAAWPSGLTFGQTRAMRPVRVDQERRPGGAPVRLAVVLLLDPRAVRLGDRVVLVGEERERQAELLAERALAVGALRADPPDVGAALRRSSRWRRGTRTPRRCSRACRPSGRSRGRPAAALVGEAVDGARLVGQGDLGGQVAGGWACSWLEIA